MDPQQQGASNFFLNQAQQGIRDPYSGFQPIEQHARSQFNQSIPSLAERFTSLGQGAQRSSGFASAIGRAGAGLEESLAAMRSQYGLQNRGQMMQLGQIGMQPRFENMYKPGSQGLMQQLAPILAQMGMGMATGGMTSAGMFGRGMMNQFKNGKGMGAMMPWSMMQGGQ
jgi:hypothetical protein